MTQGILHRFRNKTALLNEPASVLTHHLLGASHVSSLLISLQVSHQLHLTDLPMAQVGTWVGFSYKGRKELLEFPYNMLFYLLKTLTAAPSTVWLQTAIRG